MDAKVFVIIVTYNGSRWIRKCLKSVLESTFPVHVIVVDNCSSDNTTAIIKKDFPQIELIEESNNLGFGKANNIGIQLAKKQDADYFLLLNQDAYVEQGMIEQLVSAFENSKNAGILSPVHLAPDGSLDYSFEDHVKRYTSKESLESINTLKEGIYESDFVNAACWLLSRNTVDIVGGFNPLFPHYGEDNDFIHRLHFFGLKVFIEGSVKVVHDRNQFENLEYDKLKKREVVSFLKHASNINLSGSKATIKVLDKWIRESIYYFFTFKLKKWLAVNAAFIKLLLSLNEVSKFRTMSKNKGAYL